MDVTISIIKKVMSSNGIDSDRMDFLMEYLEDRHALLEALYLREQENLV